MGSKVPQSPVVSPAMKIDRKQFLLIALSMGLGKSVTGCIVVDDQPTEYSSEQTSGQEVAATQDGSCAEWDASGECIAWNGGPAEEAGYEPASECVDWDAVGECIGWASADEAYGSDDGCAERDPTGECIRWDEVQCADYDPSGECIRWDTISEV